MPLSEDQHAVGELGSNGRHEAFGEAVRPRTPGRDLDHLDARLREHRVERGRELYRAVADEEPETVDVVAEVHVVHKGDVLIVSGRITDVETFAGRVERR